MPVQGARPIFVSQYFWGSDNNCLVAAQKMARYETDFPGLSVVQYQHNNVPALMSVLRATINRHGAAVLGVERFRDARYTRGDRKQPNAALTGDTITDHFVTVYWADENYVLFADPGTRNADSAWGTLTLTPAGLRGAAPYEPKKGKIYYRAVYVRPPFGDQQIAGR